jgi:hypothetical protein
MAQAVSYRSLTSETRFSPFGICGEQIVTGTGLSQSPSVSPVIIISPLLSILIYHLGDEK